MTSVATALRDTSRDFEELCATITAVALSRLCQQCGLCCDGSLFTRVSLSSAEVKRLDGRVALKPRIDGGVSLTQSCTALDGCRCRVYADRPQGCIDYTCLLGRALVEGETTLQGASQVVLRAHQLLQSLEGLLPPRTPLEPVSVVQRARRLMNTDGAISHQARAALAEVERYLRFHFLGQTRKLE